MQRLADALEFLGEPLTPEEQKQLDEAMKLDDAESIAAIQKLFDQRTLAGVHINPESRVKVAKGPAAAELNEQGWRVFLVKVHNEAGVTSPLRITSPNAAPLYKKSTGSPAPEETVRLDQVPHRWMDASVFTGRPMTETLSGLELEYQIIQLYSRDQGKREGILAFDIGQGTQDLGFRNELPVLFECRPAVKVRLEVIDDDGTNTTGQFVIRDELGRIYPARSRRLSPDFFFHDQVYRHHGEHVLLPSGTYDVTYTRGPEYRILNRQITVGNSEEQTESFRLKRWIRLTDHGWYSGDHPVVVRW